ncbi:MAG: hypothetical protein P1U61_00195 [Legionellaceae bacterium]|nr:hypothetical protein [Legionellaceae bacterium]
MKQWIFFLSLCLSLPAFAIAIDIPPGQWQCMAVDKKEKNFGGFGKSMNAARRAAKAECRRRSNQPKTCQTAQSYCEQGPVSTIEDRCIVSDESGRTWNTTGQDACRTAKYLCQQWQYLHGSTRSVCTIKHRMRNYDRNQKDKDKDDTILEKLLNTDD